MCNKIWGACMQISLDTSTHTWYCMRTRMPSNITVTLLLKTSYGSDAMPKFVTYLCSLRILDNKNAHFLATNYWKKKKENIYSYIIKGLLHWYWCKLPLDEVSKAALKLFSFDIPSRGSIHLYQFSFQIFNAARQQSHRGSTSSLSVQ